MLGPRVARMRGALLQSRPVKGPSSSLRNTASGRLLVPVLVLLSGWICVAAFAGGAFAADVDALISEGIALRRAGDDAAALAKFEEANAIKQSPRTLAQLGLAEQALGRWGAASRHLKAALSGGNDAWIKKNRVSIEEALKTVKQRVGDLHVVGSPAGSEVRVDGEVVGRLPMDPVTVTAGSVAIEVRAPGHLPVVRSAHVVVGGLTRESFNLQPLAPSFGEGNGGGARPAAGTSSTGAPPTYFGAASNRPSASLAAGTEPDDGGQPPQQGEGGTAGDDSGEAMRPSRVVAFIAAGLSAGALAVGVYQHLKWQNRVEKFDDDPTCDVTAAWRGSASCDTLYNEGQTARTGTFVAYGVAGALAATAAILFFVVPDSAPPSSRTVACSTGPTLMGVTCGGRF